MPLYLKNESICADWTDDLKYKMNMQKSLYIYFLHNQFLPLLLSKEKLEEGEIVSGEVEYGETLVNDEKYAYLILINRD